MFSGLGAFPLTPMNETGIDDRAFLCLIKRLVESGEDSIGALGPSGSYVYISRTEHAYVARLAIEHAERVPVTVGISAPGQRTDNNADYQRSRVVE